MLGIGMFNMEDAILLIPAVLGVGVGCTLLIISVRKVYAEEAAEQGEGWFHPVGVIKFFLLSTVSIGLYSFYWFWRCWRRYRITEEADIRPFLRTFFSVFWIVALFRAANDKTDTKWPIWIAAISTAIIVISSISVQLAFNENIPAWQTEPVVALTTLGYVPLIMQINRINTPELVTQRARFSKLDWYALAFGTPFWFASLFIE